MDFKAERVKQINCGKCGEAIDPSTVKPLAGVDCPKCGNHFTVPAAFGDFLLVDVLGHGAAGIVCKGFDENLHRQVAIKILRSDVGDEEIVKACQHEARALAALNHPHVVQVHSIGEYRGQPYIVMELLDGGTVEKTMLGEPADEARAVDIAIHAAEGLQAAQHVGLVHMDVKPGNILFDRQGTAKLIDFGVARFGRTGSDQIVGTPYYVAPEIVRGDDATQQADIYSLGATLFHLLAGRPPFIGATATEVITTRLKNPAPSLEEFRSDLSPTTIETVARMLEADPADRYRNYAELIEDLRRPLDDGVRIVHQAARESRSATAARTRIAATRSKKKDHTALIVSAMMIASLVLIAIVIAVLALNRGQSGDADRSSTWGDNPNTRREPVTQAPRPAPLVEPAPAPKPVAPAKSDQPAEPAPPAPDVKPQPMTETPAPKPEPEPVPAPAPEQPKPEPPKPAETPKPTPKPAPKIEPSHVAFDPFYDRSEALADNGGWNVLEIVEAGSQQGMTMKRLADGSVLFTGAMTPHGDTCTLTARTTLKNVTGFRFDALLDEDHPDAGPAHNSIIVVNELAATVASKGQTAPPEPVKFANAKATTHSKDWEPSRLLDDKASTGWASSHETIKQPQHLLLTCDSPIGDGDMTTLRFTLKFRKPTEAMRRIQISATTAADPLTLDATPAPLVRRDRIAFVPLHPQHAESKDKATMTIQEDQSVLVDAKHTSPDVYTVMFETSLANISAFELEALTDDSLRDNGPGTAIGGRFTLSEFEMTIAPKSNPSAGQAVKFDRAMADYSSEKFPVEHAIDGNAKTPWFVNDRPGESRTAVFIPASPVGVEGGSVIIVTLQQQRMNLGRFRLRATTADDPAALAPEPIEATPEKTDKPAPAAEKSDGAQDVRLFFNAGGSDAEWSGAKWVTAPTYKKGAAGYDLAQGGRSFDAKTVNNPVTDTCLLKIEAFRATVPNGRYKVTLVFAELTESTDAGHRKFSVLAESKPVRNFMNIDPFADGKGRGSPSTRSAVITVSDGVLDLEFKGVAADTTPILNAVSIIGLR